MYCILSLALIQKWLLNHQKRLSYGDDIPTFKDIAEMSLISRQTLYAVLNGHRGEYGKDVQIRLSRVINQLNADPNYSKRSNMARIDLTGSQPKIQIGVFKIV